MNKTWFKKLMYLKRIKSIDSNVHPHKKPPPPDLRSIYNSTKYHNIFVIAEILFHWRYSSTREFFTHIETSLLTVKGWMFLPILGIHVHWAVKVIKCIHILWNERNMTSYSISNEYGTTCWSHFNFNMDFCLYYRWQISRFLNS